MPEGHTLLLYLAALGAVYLAPGPDMALLVATAAGRGTRAGLRTALGLAAARYCHCLAAGLGLAALFAAHPPLQSAVRAAGAAYLLWLAWKALRAGPPAAPSESEKTTRALRAPSRDENAPARLGGKTGPGGTSPTEECATSHGSRTATGLWPDFSRGLLTNLLNPKALLFCGLFLPQFVSASRGALLPQFLLLGALLVAVGFTFDTVYALMAGGLPGLLRRRRGTRTAGADTAGAGGSWAGRARRWLMGSVFAALAARLVAG